MRRLWQIHFDHVTVPVIFFFRRSVIYSSVISFAGYYIPYLRTTLITGGKTAAQAVLDIKPTLSMSFFQQLIPPKLSKPATKRFPSIISIEPILLQSGSESVFTYPCPLLNGNNRKTWELFYVFSYPRLLHALHNEQKQLPTPIYNFR